MSNQRFQYSPTALNTLDKRCPRALDFYQLKSVPRFTSVFEAGSAAHFILEYLGHTACKWGRTLTEAEIFDVAVEGEGRLVEGVESHGYFLQVPPTKAIEGRDMAVEYATVHGLNPEAVMEWRIALDKDWNRVEWDSPNRRLRMILDRMYPMDWENDDESIERVLVVEDFKSSYQTSDDDLDKVQMLAQACAVHKCYGDIDKYAAIIVRLSNIRTMRIHEKRYDLGDPDSEEQFARMRKSLDRIMDAADFMAHKGQRPARPGHGCCGCPYLGACPEATRFFEMQGIPPRPEERAAVYAIAKAKYTQMHELLKLDMEEEGGNIIIPDEDGNPHTEVGYLVKETRSFGVDASKEIYKAWVSRDGANINGFFEAIKGLGATQVKALVRAMFPRKKQEQNEFLGKYETVELSPRFGIRATVLDGEDAHKEDEE